jgi:hypothetical protein
MLAVLDQHTHGGGSEHAAEAETASADALDQRALRQ